MPEANDYLDRNQKPRVHIKYPVAVKGRPVVRKEIPLIMGVMAGLSGNAQKSLGSVADREFKNVDKENFDKFLAAQTPKLAFGVTNKLGKEGGEGEDISINLEFRNMKDFDPANVARNVPVLNKLLEARKQLDQLLESANGKEKTEERLNQLMRDPDLQKALAEPLKDQK